jgi:type II secretory pathway component GspD/PulD (secretin)
MLLFAALLPAYGQQSAISPQPAQPQRASGNPVSSPVQAPASSAITAPERSPANGSAALPALCSDQANSKLPRCPTADEKKRAAREFHEALKLQQRSRVREAFGHFEKAVALAPDNIEYLTAREIARQKLVFEDVQAGNQAMAAGKTIEALGRFREALQFDPDNDFARQRLREALPRIAQVKEPDAFAEAIRLQPEAGPRNFHLRGSTRDIITQVALAYGITALFDDSVASRPVRLDLEEATWQQASSALTRLTKTLWSPLSARQVLFAADTDENRRSLQRMSMCTFYIPQATTPQALNEISNTLRTLFEVRYSAVDPRVQTLTVRADTRTLDAITDFLQALKDQLPEVMFQVDVLQVSRTFTRAIGANVPSSFHVFNVPTELQSLSSSLSQSQISQILSGQASASTIAALAALLSSSSSQSSLLSQPFAVFGGGITLSALTIPAASFSFSRDLSSIQMLQSMTLRASQGTSAIMKIGERYPVLNSSYASIYSSSAISQLLGTQNSLAAYPSFTYQDIGFNMKATPIVHRDNSIDIKLEMQIRSLGTQTVNGIPIINNQEFNGVVSAKDGESIIAASNLTQSESRTLQGYSLLTAVPGLSNRNTQVADSELLVVLTPHVVIANPTAGPIILLPNTTPR